MTLPSFSKVIAQEPFFLCNPMVGYLLTMYMIYSGDTKNAYIMYGLETASLLGQSFVLVQMQRSAELCVHSMINYVFCGLVIYVLIQLTGQGGYCIVNNRIQSIFFESTCNVGCIDEASCFRCNIDGNSTACFIRF